MASAQYLTIFIELWNWCLGRVDHMSNCDWHHSGWKLGSGDWTLARPFYLDLLLCSKVCFHFICLLLFISNIHESDARCNLVLSSSSQSWLMMIWHSKQKQEARMDFEDYGIVVTTNSPDPVAHHCNSWKYPWGDRIWVFCSLDCNFWGCWRKCDWQILPLLYCESSSLFLPSYFLGSSSFSR